MIFGRQLYEWGFRPFYNILFFGIFQAEQSLMTFEGVQMQGSAKIMEKISSLTFERIAHSITAIDCQPMFDGGILINVLGQLKVRE